MVTNSGFGKRTLVADYRKTSRGAKGVKTIAFTEAKGLLAGALVVREHQELVFISQNGMVQRTGVRGINRYGRASQGVRVMNLREGDVVSAVALVVESDTSTAASAAALDEGVEGVAELDGAGVGEPDDPGAEAPEVTEETDEDEA